MPNLPSIRKGKATVERIDRGYERIKKVVESLKADRSYVSAGVIGAKATAPRKGEKTTLTNAMLAAIHEFGVPSKGIPARPFIRASFDKHRAGYLLLLRGLVKAAVYQGKITYPQALGIIGTKMAADMKMYVTVGPEIPPPNSPAWFAEKMRRGYHAQRKLRKYEGPLLPPRTLVDSGRMVGSITHSVVIQSSGASAKTEGAK